MCGPRGVVPYDGRNKSRLKEFGPMGMRINTSVSALDAQRNLSRTTNALARNLEKMSSGLRINRAADDAAGMAASEQFSSQIRQAQAESNNYQSAINMTQTADSGLEQQQSAIQRVRELAVQASNGTMSPTDRQALNAEAQQLLGQVSDIADQTQFNNQKLLDQNRSIPVGAGNVQVQLNGSTNASLGVSGIDLSTAAGAQAALGSTDQALQQLEQNRSGLGAQMNGFESAINVRDTQVENQQAAQSRIRDADVARLSIEQSKNQLLSRAGLSALSQSNVSNQNALMLLGR